MASKKKQIVIKVLGKEYVWQQIKIVSAYAPTAKLDIRSLFAKPTNNPIVDDDVLRVCRLSKTSPKATVITGYNKFKLLKESNAEVVDMVLVSASYLERCLVPPKPLDGEELQKRLLNAGNKTSIKVTVGKQKGNNDPNKEVSQPKQDKPFKRFPPKKTKPNTDTSTPPMAPAE